MSASFRIVFDEDGYPRELLGPSDWVKAVQQGQLKPGMPITLYRDGEAPAVCRADELPELRVLFAPERDLNPDSETAEAAAPVAEDGGEVPSAPDRSQAKPALQRQRAAKLSSIVTTRGAREDPFAEPQSAWGQPIEVEPDGLKLIKRRGVIKFQTPDRREFHTRFEATSHMESITKRRAEHQLSETKDPDGKKLLWFIIGVIVLIVILS